KRRRISGDNDGQTQTKDFGCLWRNMLSTRIMDTNFRNAFTAACGTYAECILCIILAQQSHVNLKAIHVCMQVFWDVNRSFMNVFMLRAKDCFYSLNIAIENASPKCLENMISGFLIKYF